ncbi:MAG: hypothetical protein ACYC5O_10760 [Anaerolineae bacterium]
MAVGRGVAVGVGRVADVRGEGVMMRLRVGWYSGGTGTVQPVSSNVAVHNTATSNETRPLKPRGASADTPCTDARRRGKYMRLMSLAGRLFFLLGGLLLLTFGFAAGGTMALLMPACGVYFMMRGVCFLGASLT